MNAVSSVVGIVLIPFLGIAWELVPGLLLQKVFHFGTFNAITWIGTLLFSVLATTAVEASAVKWGFKIALSQRRTWALSGANFVSVAIAFIGLRMHPSQF